MAIKIQVRRGTTPIGTQLDVGEFGFRTDTGELAIGTGVGNSAIRIITQKTFTAKGQILVGTGNGTFTTLSVGSDGQVLTADSTQESGVRWATISGGGSSTFIGLTDTPSSYTGYAGYLVAVKTTADGVEFVNVIDGGTL
jgi:hypothetical protein